MATSKRMRQLYTRLARVGFSRQYIRQRVLPEDWSDDKASTEESYQLLLSLLSEYLNINLASLQNETAWLGFDKLRARFFLGPEVPEDMDAGLHIIEGVARVALSSMPSRGPVSVPPAFTVRREILSRGEKWVDFRNLLDYCWRIGIPVLHVQHVPPKAKRLRAAVGEVEGRPAIVLSQLHKYSSWHLKPLAHEVGHVAGNHLGFIGLLNSTEAEMRFNGITEGEAQRYAVALLTGGQEIPPDYKPYRSIDDLVETTLERANLLRVDPGYLIMNRVSHTRNWPEANRALSIIEGDTNAIDLINAKTEKYLNLGRLPAASQHFFRSVTGISYVIHSNVSRASLPHPITPALPSQVTPHTSPTMALFAEWAVKYATIDPEEIAQRQREGDELLAALREHPLSLRRTELLDEEAA